MGQPYHERPSKSCVTLPYITGGGCLYRRRCDGHKEEASTAGQCIHFEPASQATLRSELKCAQFLSIILHSGLLRRALLQANSARRLRPVSKENLPSPGTRLTCRYDSGNLLKVALTSHRGYSLATCGRLMITHLFARIDCPKDRRHGYN
jgi:hypothetical protein